MISQAHSTAFKIARSQDDRASCFASLGTSVSPSLKLIAKSTKYVRQHCWYERQSDINLARYLALDGKLEKESLATRQDSLALHIHRASYDSYV